MLGRYLCTCSRPQRELDFSKAHSKKCIRPQCNRLLTPLYSCPFHQHAWKYLASKPCMPRSATACSHDPEHSNPKFFYFSFRKLARNRTKLILEAVKIKLANPQKKTSSCSFLGHTQTMNGRKRGERKNRRANGRMRKRETDAPCSRQCLDGAASGVSCKRP